MENYIYAGKIFKLINELDITKEKKAQKYMLVQCHDEGFVFQIICISGYNIGLINGYIKEDPIAKSKNVKGVTREHLISEIVRNFVYEKDSLEILDGENG
jgi:hypothetical protein